MKSNQSISKDSLQKFISEFHHEIRNPLSVISNELHLLKGDNEGAELALKKVKFITNLLGEVDSILSSGKDIDDISLKELSEKVSEAE